MTSFSIKRNRSLVIPSLRCQYFEEPPLRFANGGEYIDPKIGISRFGPKSYKPTKRHPFIVRIGFIGSAESIENAKKWIENCCEGIEGNQEHPEFPGYQSDRGFFSNLN